MDIWSSTTPPVVHPSSGIQESHTNPLPMAVSLDPVVDTSYQSEPGYSNLLTDIVVQPVSPHASDAINIPRSSTAIDNLGKVNLDFQGRHIPSKEVFPEVNSRISANRNGNPYIRQDDEGLMESKESTMSFSTMKTALDTLLDIGEIPRARYVTTPTSVENDKPFSVWNDTPISMCSDTHVRDPTHQADQIHYSATIHPYNSPRGKWAQLPVAYSQAPFKTLDNSCESYPYEFYKHSDTGGKYKSDFATDTKASTYEVYPPNDNVSYAQPSNDPVQFPHRVHPTPNYYNQEASYPMNMQPSSDLHHLQNYPPPAKYPGLPPPLPSLPKNKILNDKSPSDLSQQANYHNLDKNTDSNDIIVSAPSTFDHISARAKKYKRNCPPPFKARPKKSPKPHIHPNPNVNHPPPQSQLQSTPGYDASNPLIHSETSSNITVPPPHFAASQFKCPPNQPNHYAVPPPPFGNVQAPNMNPSNVSVSQYQTSTSQFKGSLPPANPPHLQYNYPSQFNNCTIPPRYPTPNLQEQSHQCNQSPLNFPPPNLNYPPPFYNCPPNPSSNITNQSFNSQPLTSNCGNPIVNCPPSLPKYPPIIPHNLQQSNQTAIPSFFYKPDANSEYIKYIPASKIFVQAQNYRESSDSGNASSSGNLTNSDDSDQIPLVDVSTDDSDNNDIGIGESANSSPLKYLKNIQVSTTHDSTPANNGETVKEKFNGNKNDFCRVGNFQPLNNVIYNRDILVERSENDIFTNMGTFDYNLMNNKDGVEETMSNWNASNPRPPIIYQKEVSFKIILFI